MLARMNSLALTEVTALLTAPDHDNRQSMTAGCLPGFELAP